MEFSQEKWNLVLDLKDMVNNHSKTINKMAKVINSQEQKIKELEVKLMTKNTNDTFNDIFKGTPYENK